MTATAIRIPPMEIPPIAPMAIPTPPTGTPHTAPTEPRIPGTEILPTALPVIPTPRTETTPTDPMEAALLFTEIRCIIPLRIIRIVRMIRAAMIQMRTIMCMHSGMLHVNYAAHRLWELRAIPRAL